MSKYAIYIVILTFCFTKKMNAQTLCVSTSDGSIYSQNLANFEKISFDGNLMKFHYTNGTIYSKNLSLVNYLDFCSNVVSVEEEKMDAGFSDFRLFPNPTNDNITLSFSINIQNSVEVNIMSLDGRTVHRIDYGLPVVGENEVEVSLNGLSSGYYICQLMVGKTLVSKSFILN